MITSLYAGILAILFFKLSFDTINARRRHQISVGHGPNNEILEVVSAHANFSAYTVLLLFLVFLAEQSQVVPVIAIHILAGAFTLGRVLHYIAFTRDKMNFKFRILGMQLTLFPLVILGLLNVYIYISKNLL